MSAVGAWMLDQLPNHLREDDFFCRFVDLFGTVATGTFDHADALPFLADPEVTPLAMVHHLARWLDADITDRAVPPERQRELLGQLGPLLAWRGTRRGLVDLLALLTEGAVEVTDDGGVFAEGEAPENVRLVSVRLERAGTIPAEHLVDLIAAEIPADCTVALWVGGARVPTRTRNLQGRR